MTLHQPWHCSSVRRWVNCTEYINHPTQGRNITRGQLWCMWGKWAYTEPWQLVWMHVQFEGPLENISHTPLIHMFQSHGLNKGEFCHNAEGLKYCTSLFCRQKGPEQLNINEKREFGWLEDLGDQITKRTPESLVINSSTLEPASCPESTWHDRRRSCTGLGVLHTQTPLGTAH